LSGIDAAGESATAGAEPPQALIGYRTNEEWQALVDEVGALIASLDEIGDAEQSQKVFAALEGIDSIHREALHRLVRLFKEGVLEQVVTDPAIRTLMGMYDLMPPEEPGCAKVWDFLAPDEKPEPSHADRSDARHGSIAARPPGELPHWSPAPLPNPPAEGEAVVCALEEGSVLVAKVRGEFLAADASCPHHDALMSGGTLTGYSWVCPHGLGCVYDLRSGARLGGGSALACLPVREDTRGRLLIGFGMPFAPRLPAF
jgi:nitrite reductase/ring-hydroxylating ferredoxin subunit